MVKIVADGALATVCGGGTPPAPPEGEAGAGKRKAALEAKSPVASPEAPLIEEKPIKPVPEHGVD